MRQVARTTSADAWQHAFAVQLALPQAGRELIPGLSPAVHIYLPGFCGRPFNHSCRSHSPPWAPYIQCAPIQFLPFLTGRWRLFCIADPLLHPQLPYYPAAQANMRNDKPYIFASIYSIAQNNIIPESGAKNLGRAVPRPLHESDGIAAWHTGRGVAGEPVVVKTTAKEALVGTLERKSCCLLPAAMGKKKSDGPGALHTRSGASLKPVVEETMPKEAPVGTREQKFPLPSAAAAGKQRVNRALSA
jgi:hypothetical protein